MHGRESSILDMRPAIKDLPADKNSSDYLKAVNGNPKEKIIFILEALEKDELPLVNSGISSQAENPSINILEIGPGGGGSIDVLQNYLKITDNYNEQKVKIFSAELLKSTKIESDAETKIRVANLKQKSSLVSASAAALPFQNESMSAVNASAVLHEVNSYANGYESVKHTLSEVNRVLLPGGVFGYRDVLTPVEDIHNTQTHIYNIPSWNHFIKYFVPYFLSHGRKLYDQNNIIIKQNEQNIELRNLDADKGFKISAPVGLFRETQRHYLTFRDHLLRGFALGVKINNECIVDGEKGVKELEIEVNPNNRLAVDEIEKKSDRMISKNIYHISNSLEFDRSVDKLMEHFFKTYENGDQESENILEAWLNREGREYYLYYNIPQLLEQAAIQSLAQSNGAYVLLPKSDQDIKILSRDYYQRYINATLENALPEGKQLIKFTKLSHEEAMAVLDDLEKSEYLKKIFGENYQDTFESIRQLLDKR